MSAEPEKVLYKGIRRTAARHMVAAWQAPVFHLTVEVDMSQAMIVKKKISGANVTDVVIAAVARALSQFPEMNIHVDEDGYTIFHDVHVGLAVASERGLTVPVIHGAQALSISEIAENRKTVVERARTSSLTREDVTGGTFTISNLGMMGIRRFDAIVNVPQGAILAVGNTEQRYRLADGEPKWLPISEFTLTCDHRAIDGALGASFLSEFSRLLSETEVV